MSIRPTLGSESRSKALGEKSRSVIAQAAQRSVTITVTDLPWSKRRRVSDISKTAGWCENSHVAVIFLPQTGFSLGLAPL